MAMVLAAGMSLPAFAGTSSNWYGNVHVSTTCNTKDSSHSVSGASSGSARLYYTDAGLSLSKGPDRSSSGSGYWSAYCSISGGTASRATTTYNGNVVTARP